MARLVYKNCAAQQWPSWVVPLRPLCDGTEQQMERLKLSLLCCVNSGTLEAFGTLEQHLVLNFAAGKQACDVRRFLATACQRQLELQPLSLDPFHVEQFGWDCTL